MIQWYNPNEERRHTATPTGNTHSRNTRLKYWTGNVTGTGAGHSTRTSTMIWQRRGENGEHIKVSEWAAAVTTVTRDKKETMNLWTVTKLLRRSNRKAFSDQINDSLNNLNHYDFLYIFLMVKIGVSLWVSFGWVFTLISWLLLFQNVFIFDFILLTNNKDIQWKVYLPVILWLLGSLWE